MYNIYIDNFTSRPHNSLLLNVQERQKYDQNNIHFNMIDVG